MKSVMGMHTATLPASELMAWRSRLARRYGATVVDEGDRRILVIRVPRQEPDPVNDVEAAVDYLDAADVEDITHCLLMGDNQVAQVYAGPLRDLLQERQHFDAQEVQGLRKRLPSILTHQIYRSPADPRRRWRLAVRLPCDSVRDLQEDHLEELAEDIGGQLEGPRFAELAAVYLIASHDDVRMEADHFVQELREAWQDEDRKRRKEAERRAHEEAERREKERDRQRLVADLDAAFRKREAEKARLEREERAWVPQSGDPATDAYRLAARRQAAGTTSSSTRSRPSGHAVSNQAIRELAAPRAPLLSDEQELTPRPPGTEAEAKVQGAIREHDAQVDDLQDRVDGLTRRAQDVRPGEAPIDAVARKLTLLGYDVLFDPETGYAIDLAAERQEGDMQRLVFRFVARLDPAIADELLRTARELDVDQVFCVADHAEDRAKRMLSATKVTWFRPRELGSLRL